MVSWSSLCGRGERGDLEQRLLVVEVAHQSLFEDLAELAPEGAVIVRPLGLQFLDRREDLLGQPAPDRIDLPILLQDLAGDVQRQVLCVHDALDEAQVSGHELVAVAHDEDAFDVQLHTDGGVGLVEVERGPRRNKQQRLVFERALGLHRDDLERLVPGVRDVLVELLVLLVGHLVLGPGPQRLTRVERLDLLGDGLFAAVLRPGERFSTSIRIGQAMKSEYFLTSVRSFHSEV